MDNKKKITGAIKEGHIPGHTPFGYKRDGKLMIPDITTKHIIERMYQLYFEGNSYQTIAKLERQILEQEQIKELKFTPEDILIKRDMDFINQVKLPMLYKAIVECWEDLDREEKSRIIMNYIDDIKLTKNTKGQYVVDSVNFRTTFYKDFKKLYDDGFIDWKRKFIYDFNGIRIDSKIRYSEYLPFKKVYEHIKRLSDCYDVAFYKETYYKDTGRVDMLPLKKGEVIVRMFPTEEDDSNKDKIGMGMICVSDSPKSYTCRLPRFI